MPVVGVWAETGAHKLAQSVAGTTTTSASAGCAALAGSRSDGFSPRSVRVGEVPTSSEISIAPDELLLARGAAWTAPIYYRARGPTWLASSSLKALVEPGDELDVARIAAMITYASERGESRSVYRDIRLVPPFETVTIGRGGLRRVRRPTPRLQPRPHATVAQLAEELRERIFAAVERTAGSRRVGIMLSGGLDSSAVLAALLALRGARQEDVHVTLDFDAPGSDRPHILALERHYGIHVVRTRPSEVTVGDALVMDGSPSRHHGDAWTVLCAKRASAQGAELLMTGTGGDQLFGGAMGFGVRSGVLDRDFRGAWDALRATHPYRLSPRYRLRMSLGAMIRPHLPSAVHRWRARTALRRVPPWAGSAVRDELLIAFRTRAEHPAPRSAQERFDDHVRSPYESEYCAEARAQTDSVSPIPRVDPLYDDELVQFLASIPHQLLFAGGTYRGLLRLAMRGFLPESVRMRIDKSDFEPACADAFCPFDRFADLLSFKALDAARIVVADEFRRHLAPLYATPREFESGPLWLDFWPALAAEAFLRRS